MIIDDLIFDYGWRKPFSIYFNKNNVEIELVFDSYEGEKINDKQLSSYKKFLDNKTEYENKTQELITKYIIDNAIEKHGVIIKTLQFNYDGSFGFLADCEWDIENGIAIILAPEESVVIQDQFF